MLKWLDTREVNELARTIAAYLIERVPARGIKPSDRKGLEKLVRTHGSIFEQLTRFAHGRSLNFYQKASFGNTFKWELKEAGYPSEVVEAWTREVVTHLARKFGKKA